MRNSYIANSSEALNLHNGSQTAIVVAMKVQPKSSDVIERNGKITVFEPDNVFPLIGCYRIGQEVYVREKWVYRHKHDKYYYKADHSEFEPYCHQGWESPATMPKSAARTRFIPVSCEAVRVKEMTEEQAKLLCLELYKNLDGTFGGHGAPTTYKAQFQYYAIAKFGKSAWDNNQFIWYYKIEKI